MSIKFSRFALFLLLCRRHSKRAPRLQSVGLNVFSQQVYCKMICCAVLHAQCKPNASPMLHASCPMTNTPYPIVRHIGGTLHKSPITYTYAHSWALHRYTPRTRVHTACTYTCVRLIDGQYLNVQACADRLLNCY